MRLAIVSTPGIATYSEQAKETYISEVIEKLKEIQPDHVLCMEKIRSKTSSKAAKKELIDRIKKSGVHSITEMPSGYTHNQNLHDLKKYILANLNYKDIESFDIISPNILIYKQMFLTTKYLASIVGYHKDEYEILEAVTDILKVTPSKKLIESTTFKVGKFTYHSIAADWPLEEIHRQILSSLREMIGDRYRDMDKNYIEWKKSMT